MVCPRIDLSQYKDDIISQCQHGASTVDIVAYLAANSEMNGGFTDCPSLDLSFMPRLQCFSIIAVFQTMICYAS